MIYEEIKKQGIAELADLFVAVTCARLINRGTTLKDMLLPTRSNIEEWGEYIRNKEIYWGSAYRTLQNTAKGKTRKDTLLELIPVVALVAHQEQDNFPKDGRSWNDLLKTISDKHLTKLIRYEIVLDLWHILGMEEEYVDIGVGAEWTLKRLFPNTHVCNDDLLFLKDWLNEHYPLTSAKWGKLTMRCVEGLCCEYRKYWHLKNLPGYNKRKYHYGNNPRLV